MKRAVSISLRFIALVALYMLIGWAFGMYETFSIWRMLLMGCVFSGIMLGFSDDRIILPGCFRSRFLK
ncbi:MAG: hypothetical protein IJZ70_03750 [Bacteroidales bacterium]|nr:hypothetical protein [Bacteroidales bacterium]